MVRLAKMVSDRAKARTEVQDRILDATAKLPEDDTKAVNAGAGAVLDAMWKQLDKLDPSTPNPTLDGDIQVAGIKSRIRDIQAKQERLADLALADGDLLGGREAALTGYEYELMDLSKTLAAISEQS